MRALCLAALVLGGLWACSSFTTGSTDTPADDAGANDATASLDATPPSPDAGTFCASRPEPLCADFEVNGIYGGDWAANQNIEQAPAHGSIERDATMGLASAASLHATLLKGSDTANVTLELGAFAATIPGAAYLEADVYVKAPLLPFGAQLTVLSLQRGPDASLADVEAKITYIDPKTYQFALYAQTTSTNYRTIDSAVVSFGTWVHLRLESRLVGTGKGSATLVVDKNPSAFADDIAQLTEPDVEHMRAILGLARYKEMSESDVELYTDNVFAGPLP